MAVNNSLGTAMAFLWGTGGACARLTIPFSPVNAQLRQNPRGRSKQQQWPGLHARMQWWQAPQPLKQSLCGVGVGHPQKGVPHSTTGTAGHGALSLAGLC